MTAKTKTSERELCQALAAAGRTVSAEDLRLWRKASLLPPLASAGLGTGKGKNYYWGGRDIVQHALLVCDELRRHGRADQTLISLFLAGFNVQPEQLRRAWLHRAKMRKPPRLRTTQAIHETSSMTGISPLLKAALCIAGAVAVEEAPCRASTILLTRALARLGLMRLAANDTGMDEQLWHLLNIVGSTLDSSGLVRDAANDELLEAQHYLGETLAFLKECNPGEDTIPEKLVSQIFLFCLTLLRSGQAGLLDGLMDRIQASGWRAPAAPARGLGFSF